MLNLLLAASSFVPPASRAAAPRTRAVRMEDEGFKLPELPKFEMPKLDLGGIEFGEGDDKSKQKGLTPRDGDVQFVDTDGDTITLRKSPRGKYVDYYAGELLKIQDGTLERSGSMLQVSGIDQSDWKFKFFNGNFKSEITDGMTPRDPAVLDAAMALVE